MILHTSCPSEEKNRIESNDQQYFKHTQPTIIMSTRRNFLKTAAIPAPDWQRSIASAPQKLYLAHKNKESIKDGKSGSDSLGRDFVRKNTSTTYCHSTCQIVAICDVSDFSLNMTKETFKRKGKNFLKFTKEVNMNTKKCSPTKNSM
jgi:hypothetical protein